MSHSDSELKTDQKFRIKKIVYYKAKRKCNSDLINALKSRLHPELQEQRLLRLVSVHNTEAVEKLLESGVDANCCDRQLRSALHIAASRGYADIVESLLKHGADPNKRDIIQNTPLHLAACTSNLKIITLLINGGANIRSLDLHGRNPLQLAESKLQLLQRSWCEGAIEMIQVRSQIKEYNSALHFASYLRTTCPQQTKKMSMEIERPNLAVAKPVTINLALFSRLSRNREEMLHYLQEWTLIPRVGDYKCPKPKCKAALKLMYLSASKDGWVWYCSKRASINNQKVKQCRHQIAIRTGTFFARSKLELWQIMGFVNLWVDNASLDIITGQVRMNSRAAIAWGTACKQVIFTNYLRNRVKLGGEGITVEIYESSHDSRQTEKKWVFGVYERNTGNLFMVSVKFKDANTLVPIIKERIQVGTTIVSDFWRNYDCLNTEDYTDLKVNQNICFKNPDASLTSSWWHLTKISFSGRISAPKPGNLAKYLFLKRCRKMNLDKTREFFRLTGNIHNPARTGEDADISEDDVLDSEDEWTY